MADVNAISSGSSSNEPLGKKQPAKRGRKPKPALPNKVPEEKPQRATARDEKRLFQNAQKIREQDAKLQKLEKSSIQLALTVGQMILR